MKIEREIQQHIHKNGWNLNYDGNTATNIFGTEYNVTIQDTKGYFDLSNVQLRKKEITIKDACEFHQDVFNAEVGAEYMAYELAHEVAHTKTFLKWSSSALLATFLLSEVTAEVGAHFIHGAKIEGDFDLYKTLLDLL